MTALLGQLLRFGLTTGLSFVVNFGGTVFLREIVGLPPETAFAIAIAVVFVMNFFTLRHFVYAGRTGPFWRQAAGYAVTSGSFRLGEYLAFLLFHTLCGFEYRLVLLVVLVVSTLLKFVAYRRVFHRTTLSS